MLTSGWQMREVAMETWDGWNRRSSRLRGFGTFWWMLILAGNENVAQSPMLMCQLGPMRLACHCVHRYIHTLSGGRAHFAWVVHIMNFIRFLYWVPWFLIPPIIFVGSSWSAIQFISLDSLTHKTTGEECHLTNSAHPFIGISVHNTYRGRIVKTSHFRFVAYSS